LTFLAVTKKKLQKLQQLNSKAHIKQSGVSINRRHRRISRENLIIFKKLFKKNTYPPRLQKESVALEANMKVDQVNRWFNDRRKLFKCNYSCNLTTKPYCKCSEKKKDKLKNNEILSKSFETNQFLESVELKRLKQETNLSELVIKKWFLNRRYRLTKKGHGI